MQANTYYIAEVDNDKTLDSKNVTANKRTSAL